MTRVIVLLVGLLLQAAAPQSGRGSLEGTVVQSKSGAPATNASVELIAVEDDRVASRTATTDANGRFVFTNLPPNDNYQLVATGPGIWSTAYGQLESRGPWSPVKLAAGEHLKDLRIFAPAKSQVSGKVISSTGEPLPGATVLALTPVYVDGLRELRRMSTAVTNLRGEYQVSNLPPGRYYFRATARMEGPENLLFANPSLFDRQRNPQNPATAEGYRAAFYPGGTVESAKPVLVEDGEVMENFDIKLEKVRTGRVRGTVVDEGTGKKIEDAQLLLIPEGLHPDSFWTRIADSKDGEFDLRSVQPGRYFLFATSTVITSSTVPGRSLVSRTRIEVRSGQSQTVTVRLESAREISGRVVLDDKFNVTNFSGINVTLAPDPIMPLDSVQPRARSMLPTATTSVAEDGTFTFHNVAPWDYLVAINGTTRAYRKAPTSLRIENGNNAPLQVVLARDGGGLDGHVIDPSRKDVDSARVVLVPENRTRHDLYYWATSSKTGRFEIANIPPGRYRVFAWERVPEGAWWDQDFLQPYEDKATPIEVAPESLDFVEITAR